MLDTNAVRYFLNGERRIVEKITHYFPSAFCLSVVTEAEIRFGVAKNPEAKKFAKEVTGVLEAFEVVPWTRSTAVVYGRFRADLQKRGRPLAPLDMMIAAHALELNLMLVTADRDLLSTPGLRAENWLAG